MCDYFERHRIERDSLSLERKKEAVRAERAEASNHALVKELQNEQAKSIKERQVLQQELDNQRMQNDKLRMLTRAG